VRPSPVKIRTSYRLPAQVSPVGLHVVVLPYEACSCVAIRSLFLCCHTKLVLVLPYEACSCVVIQSLFLCCHTKLACSCVAIRSLEEEEGSYSQNSFEVLRE
jgi:hypothetical protein